MRKPTARQVRSLLSQCAFNPNEPGVLSNIVKGASDEYLARRAIEMIEDELLDPPIDRLLIQAIQLLTLIRARRECLSNQETSEKAPKPKFKKNGSDS